MVSKVLGRIKHDTGTSHTYQDIELSRYNEEINYLQTNKIAFTDSVVASLKERVQDHHTTLLSDVLLVLATQGWEKSLSLQAVERLTVTFIEPLQKAGTGTEVFREE